jgi:hypothetical protein
MDFFYIGFGKEKVKKKSVRWNDGIDFFFFELLNFEIFKIFMIIHRRFVFFLFKIIKVEEF